MERELGAALIERSSPSVFIQLHLSFAFLAAITHLTSGCFSSSCHRMC